MAQVFPLGAVRQEVRERIEKRNVKWDVSPTAAQWVEDYYPDVWAKAEHCRVSYTPHESMTRPDKWKIVASSCWKVPWCVPCSLSKGQARLRSALSKVSRATPKGQPRRVIPWTVVAPVYDDNTGIGMAASNDLGRYARAVSHFLHEAYDAEPGELGWIMSYQDFGEHAFQKRNPHWHITLNGYRWMGGKMTPIPSIELRRSGGAKIHALWDNALQAFFPGAKTGNIRAENPAVGRGAYYEWLKYETRELVDLRKLRYDRATNTAQWVPYHDGVKRATFTGGQFEAGLEEYRARVKPDKANRVHRDGGYVVGRTLDKLAAEIGGEPETHDRETCPCDQCDDWFGVPELRAHAMGWDEGREFVPA